MSDDDDIERLLREIDGVTSGQPTSQPPARRESSEVAKPGSSQAVALVFSAVIGVVGLLLGFLPWVPGIWLGLGGFVGSYLALTIGRRFGG